MSPSGPGPQESFGSALKPKTTKTPQDNTGQRSTYNLPGSGVTDNTGDTGTAP